MKQTEPPHGEEKTPFERFEDLTRRIVAVPKEEADKKHPSVHRKRPKKH